MRIQSLINISLFLFFIAVVAAFNYSLPDPDFTLRLLVSAVFVLPISALMVWSLWKKKITSQTCMYFNFPLIILTVVVVIFSIALTKSINPNDALFEWMKWILLLFYLLVFICFFRIVSDAYQLASRMIVVVTAIIQLIGIWQLFLIWNYTQSGKIPFEINYQFSSALSNKNSFAEMLLLCLPLQYYVAISDQKKWRSLAIATLVISAIMIIALKSFSVFLALLITACLVLILAYKRIKQSVANRLNIKTSMIAPVVIVVGFVILAGSFYVFNQSDGFKKSKIILAYLKGNTTDTDLNQNSVFERIILWKNTAELIKEHPWTGSGLLNWKILAPKYGFKGALYLITDTVKFTRAHNDYLQIWAETGLFGLLAYLTLLLGALYLAIKQYILTHNLKYLVLSTAFLSFCMISLFGFPMEKMLIMLVLMVYLALLSMLQHSGKSNRIIFHPGYVLLVFTLFSFYATDVLAKRLDAEKKYQQMLYAKEKKNWVKDYQIAKQLDDTYFPIDYNATPITWYKGASAFMNQKSKEALSYYQQAVVQSPYHVLNDIGAVYMNSGDLATAEKYYDRVLKINPYFPETHFNRAITVFNSGNKLGAYKLFRKVRELHPPVNYTEYMIVVIQHIADSVFRSVNFNPNIKPEWKVKYTGTNLWYFESKAMQQNTDFITVIRHETDSIQQIKL